MKVQFKVYASLGDSKLEVRRFDIEQSVVTNYQYLVAKLEDVFPSLKNKTYTICWKDEEGDNIRISSDGELMIALIAGKDLHKLFVEVEQAKTEPEIEIGMSVFPQMYCGVEGAASADTLHPGVVCDGCEGAVRGFRYRCTVCHDFDLCSTCEALRKHPQHCMLRVPSPIVQSHDLRSKIKRMRHMKSMFTEEMCTDKAAEATECPYIKKQKRDKDHHHRRHGHKARGSWLETVASFVNEFANLAGDIGTGTSPSDFAQTSGQQASATGQQTSTSAQQTTSGQKSTTSGQQPTGSGQQPETSGQQPATSDQEPIISGQQAATSNRKTSFGQQTQTFAQKSQTSFENDEGKPSVSKTKNTSMETDDVQILPQIPFEKVLDPEHIKYFMEVQKTLSNILPNIASTLEQVGIQAENINPVASGEKADKSNVNQTSCNMSASQSSANQTTIKPTVVEPIVNPSLNQQSVSQSTIKQTNKLNEDSQLDKTDGWTVIDNDEVSYTTRRNQVPPSAPVSEVHQPIGFKNLAQDLKDLKIDSGNRVYPTLTTASTSTSTSYSFSSSTLPTSSSSAIPMPAPGTARPQPSSAVPLSSSASAQSQQLGSTPRPHANPRIADSLTQMLNMGFTDEGGWLTQLLESKDGNISAVLDLLTPVTVPRKP